MDGKIYDILNKIDLLKVEKFGLSKDNRIYLKKLLIDEDFLNEQIKKYEGVDNFYLILNKIYKLLKNFKFNFDKLKKDIIDDENGRKIIEEMELIEKQREKFLDDYLSKEINQKLDEEYKEYRIADILKRIDN